LRYRVNRFDLVVRIADALDLDLNVLAEAVRKEQVGTMEELLEE